MQQFKVIKPQILQTVLFGSLLFLSANYAKAQAVNVKQQIQNAEQQATVMLAELDTMTDTKKATKLFPRTIENGKLKTVGGKDWTSGFFAGSLWYLYQYTGNKQWLKKAQQFTNPLQPQQFFGGTHDLGFIMYCSFGNGFRLTHDTAYKAIIIQAAKTLITRFNPITGVIKSWDGNADKWTYPVIIDNMMNLEMLFEATKLSGDSSFYKVAISHADNTLKNHYRPDYSSYHVVDYNPTTGQVIKKITAQGANDTSAWARGQAWGLYGFTMCYRETHDKKYLQQAEDIAAFILAHLPADKVPFWDYDVLQSAPEPKDASAAAITASALYELSGYSKNKKLYTTTANAILSSLSSNYLAPVNTAHGFILLHSTGHKPAKSEIDTPLSYADYYYLEALLRSQKSKK